MNASTAWLLGRPRTSSGRTRAWLITGGSAVAGGLLLAALAIVRIPGQIVTTFDGGGYMISPGVQGYSDLVSQDGLKPGVITGVVLLILPALALVWQAVTTGSAGRAAVHEGLRLTGATPADLRRVAAVEPGVAGLLGGLFAGPVYLALWLVLGVWAPVRVRLLPGLSWLDAAAWPLIAVATAGVAAVGGTFTAAPRRRRPVRAWPRLLAVAVGVLAVLLVAVGPRPEDHAVSSVLNCAALTLLALGLLSTGSIWVTFRARRLTRSGTAVDLLAAGGLHAVAGAAGRTAGTLCVAGLALGVAGGLGGMLLEPGSSLSDGVAGLVLTGLAALLALLVALASLTLAAVDDVLAARRALASTAALGAEPALLEQVQRRRIAVATTGPMVAGLVLGSLYAVLGRSVAGVGVTLVTSAVALLLLRVVTAVVLRALRPRITRAAAPSSLRVA